MSILMQISNFPSSKTADSIYNLFSTVGIVEDHLMLDPNSPLNPSAGLVCLVAMTDETGDAARQRLQGYQIKENALVIAEATREQVERLNQPSRQVMRDIAKQINEPLTKPRVQIELMVELKGEAFVREVLQETFETEAKGGLMVMSQKRRRTVGGVFFFLAFEKLDKATRKQIFGRANHKQAPGERKPARPQAVASSANADKTDKPPQPDPKPPLVWAERGEILTKLTKGEATTVKLTLIGRPGQVEERKDVVVAVMSHAIKNMPLPKGLPTPPAEPTNYAVYIATKQWRKVEPALADPQDVLIIEGTGFFDPEYQGIAVLATNVTTKMLQRAKRESEQQAKTGTASSAPTPITSADSPAPTAPMTPSRPPALSNPPERRPGPQPSRNVPPPRANAPTRPSSSPPAKPVAPPIAKPKPTPTAEVIRRLSELHDAEQEARQELDEIKALPPDEQSGLTQALNRLQKIKADIKALQQSTGEL